MKPKILIVDDDKEICEELSRYFSAYEYQVYTALHDKMMWRKLREHKIDLVILDIMLPGTDGITLCRKLREQTSVPIIMLSAAGSEADRVYSLEVGADDFLAKPFSARELLARVKALMRRTTGQLGEERRTSQKTNMPFIFFAHWRLDRARRNLIDEHHVSVPLSQREYDILLALMENAKRIVTRDQLLEITRGLEASPFDRSIDVMVGRLRKKIEKDPKNPEIIITVRGGGYLFNAEVNIANT